MSNGYIMLTFDDDGVAHEYDDTYDIVIHCESQEEQDKVKSKLKIKPISKPISMQWIPVTERMPEIGEGVLVSTGRGFNTSEGYLKPDGDWHRFKYNDDCPERLVDAWMPLPKPYRPERENEKWED